MSQSCLMMNIVGDQPDLKSVIHWLSCNCTNAYCFKRLWWSQSASSIDFYLQGLRSFSIHSINAGKATCNIVTAVCVKLYFDIIVIKNMALLSFWNEKRVTYYILLQLISWPLWKKTFITNSSVFLLFQALCIKRALSHK